MTRVALQEPAAGMYLPTSDLETIPVQESTSAIVPRTERLARSVALIVGALMISWAVMVQIGGWWIAFVFVVVAGGALYEIWRKHSRSVPSSHSTKAALALALTIVAAAVGSASLLGWLPSVFSWAAPLAFFIAWFEYLASFSKRTDASDS